ncbi:takeout precursor [Penaeus vannamei]|uniref:Takeout n=1 Tax=Penaeus vannamei TaxID=6689 RepID=A0A3R7MK80_PENVA|nr:takeout precursor [Penaeus vannamei]
MVPELRVAGLYDLKDNIDASTTSSQNPLPPPSLPNPSPSTSLPPLPSSQTPNSHSTSTPDNIDASGVGKLSVQQGPDGQERLRVSDTRINFIRDISLHLSNLFNGDPLLGETVNHFLNQNSQEVLRDVKPEVSRQLNVLIQRVMNDALSQLPVSSFLITN